MALERFILKDIEIGISKDVETLNTPKLLASEYDTILCDQLVPIIPSPEMITGEDQVGDGTEGPHAPRNYRWPSTPITISAKLNNEFCRRLAKRLMGGTVTNSAPIVTGVYDHDVAMQTRAQGHDVQLTSIAAKFGGADFIYSSMAVNEMTVAQTGTDVPTVSFAMLGSGYTKRFRDVYRSQTIAFTGTPAGGSVTLDFGGTPVIINFDDSAAEVQTTFEALANIAPGDVTVTGGPLPAAVTIAFNNTDDWWAQDVPPLTLTTNSLTGGTSPGVTLSTTSPYLVLPAVPDYEKKYMHGSTLAAVMNNGDVVDLTELGILQSSVRINQQVSWKSLPGLDEFLVPGYVESGAYMACVARGERQVEPSIRLYLDSRVDEYYWQRKNLTITDLIWLWKGSRIGATTYQQEFEITVNKLKLRSTVLEPDETYGAKTLGFLPMLDTVSGGFAALRVRDGNATLT